MEIRGCTRERWLWHGVVLCWMLLSAAAVNAVEVTIRAQFKMPPGGAERRFIIAAQPTGICADAPQLCRQRETSVLLPQLRAELYPPRSQVWHSPTIVAYETAPREGPPAELQFAKEKKVMVAHATSGASYPVTFAPRLLNARLHGIYGAAFTGHLKHQTSCWTLHGTLCQRYPMDGSELVMVDGFSLVYQLHTPDPQLMLAGEYKARIEYATGPGKEWDFGRHFKFSDNKVVINLILTVVTDIAVEAAGNKVILTPVGGWERWHTNNGSNAPAIKYDMPFYLTSSAPFRVYLDGSNSDFCARRCVLRNEKFNATVIMDVEVTLPFVNRADGSEVRNMPLTVQPLRVGALSPQILQPRHYLFRQRSLLHLRVNPRRVGYMLRHRGGVYRSELRIIFDADL